MFRHEFSCSLVHLLKFFSCPLLEWPRVIYNGNWQVVFPFMKFRIIILQIVCFHWSLNDNYLLISSVLLFWMVSILALIPVPQHIFQWCGDRTKCIKYNRYHRLPHAPCSSSFSSSTSSLMVPNITKYLHFFLLKLFWYFLDFLLSIFNIK